MSLNLLARELCRGSLSGIGWPDEGETMIGINRLRNIQKLLGEVVRKDVPGDFLEAGVWRGGASIFARAVLNDLGAHDRTVFACDSFQGLPVPSFPEDTIDFSTAEQLSVPLEEVQANFARYGITNGVVFVEGWFRDTIPPLAETATLAVLRLDGDMYESTVDTLVPLYDRVSRGGFVIVDDYLLPPCKLAVDQFRQARRIRSKLVPIDGPAVYWEVQ